MRGNHRSLGLRRNRHRLAKRTGHLGKSGAVPCRRATKNADLPHRPHRLDKIRLPPQPGALSPLAPVPSQALGQRGIYLTKIVHLCPVGLEVKQRPSFVELVPDHLPPAFS